MAELVLLDPPADVVDGQVGQAHHVKWVNDHGGVGQGLGHPVGIAPMGVDGHGVHPVSHSLERPANHVCTPVQPQPPTAPMRPGSSTSGLP